MDGLSQQTKRDILSSFITLLIYLLLFFFWHHYASTLSAPSSQADASEISLDLNEFVKETSIEKVAESRSEKQIEESDPLEKEPIKEELSEKEPIKEEPILEPVVEPEPKLPPVEKPKPVVKKPKAKKKPPQKHAKKRKKLRTAHKKQALTSSRHSRQSAHGSRRGSSRFIARLKAKINANKVYPRIARKRRMQGRVKIRFRVTSTGKLSNLSATGPRIFIKSAKNAVEKSFPLSTRGALLPMNVTLTLNYRLKT